MSNHEDIPKLATPNWWREKERIDAIFADAMLKTQADFVRHFLAGTIEKNTNKQPDDYTYFHPENYELDHGLQLASENMCVEGSVALIYHLLQNPDFKELFQSAFLLGSHGDFSGEKEWLYHEYAVTQDSDNLWRAASPANHVQHKGHDPHHSTHMNRVLTGQTLEEILGQIEAIDGGDWPTAKSIENILLTQPNKRIPWIVQDLDQGFPVPFMVASLAEKPIPPDKEELKTILWQVKLLARSNQ